MNDRGLFAALHVTHPTENPDRDAAHLVLLRLLSERPDLSQRELSAALNLSLGKTHYVLHALLDQGLVKARNFRRNNNKLAYSYLLTPAGMRQKISLTRHFLARKEAEFVALQAAITMLRAELNGESNPGGPANRPERPPRPEGDSEASKVRRAAPP